MTGSSDRIQQLLKENGRLKKELSDERGKRLRNAEARTSQPAQRTAPANAERADAGKHSADSAYDCSTRGIVVLRRNGIRFVVLPSMIRAEYEGSGKAPRTKEIPDHSDLLALSLRGLIQQAEQFYSELVKRDL